MKKTLLKSTLAVLLFTGALSAEILFDLHEQHFSNVEDGNLEFGRYDLPKVYVSTAAKNYYGTYYTRDFNVEIKTPPATWSVTFDLSDYLYNTTHTLSFVSDTGRTILVTFKNNKIVFDGYEQDVSYMYAYANVSGTLTKEGNQVVLRVNGYYERTATVSDFERLKLVKIPLGSNSMLTALTIGQNN